MDSQNWALLIAVIAAATAMSGGLIGVFVRLHQLGQGFGPNSLRALGTVLFIPTLLILAIVTKFETSTLSALLGTIAGYVLSTSSPDRGASNSPKSSSERTST